MLLRFVLISVLIYGLAACQAAKTIYDTCAEGLCR